MPNLTVWQPMEEYNIGDVITFGPYTKEEAPTTLAAIKKPKVLYFQTNFPAVLEIPLQAIEIHSTFIPISLKIFSYISENLRSRLLITKETVLKLIAIYLHQDKKGPEIRSMLDENIYPSLSS